MSAAGRLAARAEYLGLAAVAEFTRRREAQLEDAKARGVPRGCRDGEFPDAELGMELVTSPERGPRPDGPWRPTWKPGCPAPGPPWPPG